MKKEKDTNKEKTTHETARPRFNAVDFLIILLVIACIGGIVVRFTVLDDLWATRNTEKYELTFTASDLSYAQCRSIAAAVSSDDEGNSWVYLSDGTTKLGDLIMTSDYMQNREEITFKETNGSIVSVIPDETIADEDVRWSIKATVLCNGKFNDKNGFLLNGRHYIAPNSEIDVRIIDCDFSMKVISIEKAVETAE